MSRLPPLKALFAFEVVARLRSVTRAAEELEVTQSAVSQQIRLLEQSLGYQLFTRENQGLNLTARGEKLVPVVRGGYESIAECIEQISQRDHYVHVSADEKFFTPERFQRLSAFRQERNDASIWINTTNMSDMSRNNADLYVVPHGFDETRLPASARRHTAQALNKSGFDLYVTLDLSLSNVARDLVAWLERS